MRSKRLFKKIESFGVKVSIEVSDLSDLEIIEEILVSELGNCFTFTNGERSDLTFWLRKSGSNRSLFLNEKMLFEGSRDSVIEVFRNTLRHEVAKNADKTFIHSGAVGWNGKGIIFPGFSYKGKTTLTVEFVKLGADYYSDEYAVIGDDGLLYPFPKFLSLRGLIDDKKQFPVAIEEINGKVGKKPIPISLVLVTEYDTEAVWRPEILSQAQGILEIVTHVLPFSEKPAEKLDILIKALKEAKFIKQKRKDARDLARRILDML